MIVRFLMLWFVLAVVAYAVIFVMTQDDRHASWTLLKRIAISVFGGGLVVLSLFFLNNISGV